MIAFAQEDPDHWQRLQDRIPLGRAGTADDAAGLAVFLGAPASAYLTGAIIPLDGGLTGAGAMD
jgi:NAD(P)-dependent dehydrogenase (short-subunit alcohol dehydrogenase family)